MIQFNLPKNTYIRQLDIHNWCVACDRTSKDGGKGGENIQGYFPSLAFAWKYCVKMYSLTEDSVPELIAVLNLMQEVEKNPVKYTEGTQRTLVTEKKIKKQSIVDDALDDDLF